MLIRLDSIRDHQFYLKADRRAFELVVEFLGEVGFKSDQNSTPVEKVMPQPDRLPFKNFLEAYDIVHYTMYLLLSFRFGHSIRNKPQFAILAEALASATDLYYATQFIRNGGNPERSHEVMQYKLNAGLLGCGFVQKFNKFLEDPFAAYKANALDSVKISKMLLGDLILATRANKVNPHKTESKIKNIPQYVFLKQKDYKNNTLFILEPMRRPLKRPGPS